MHRKCETGSAVDADHQGERDYGSDCDSPIVVAVFDLGTLNRQRFIDITGTGVCKFAQCDFGFFSINHSRY